MPACIWHIITPEYPPNIGGVSGYSQNLALSLRSAGDDVQVWCPAGPGSQPPWVHRMPDGFQVKSLKSLGEGLDRFPKPRRLLVQWVPHGFGYHSMNLPFCFWLWRRARRGDRVEIMLHEAYLQFFEGNWRQDAAAFVHRIMTIVLLRAASQVWMSSACWEQMWRPYALGRKIPFVWLPVPTTIPVHPQGDDELEFRTSLAPPGTKLIGHFGTYGNRVGPNLERVALQLLSRRKDCVLLLMGRSSDACRERMIRLDPELASRILASGELDSEGISRRLRACDLLIQPFEDGVNARRTSLIAGLAHGAAIVTMHGPMTEPFWQVSKAVASVPVDREDLFTIEAERVLDDPRQAASLRIMSRRLYEERFETRHAVRLLRGEFA